MSFGGKFAGRVGIVGWIYQKNYKNLPLTSALDFELDKNEPVHDDRGYSALPDNDGRLVFITPNTPGLNNELRKAHGRLHARHEGVNGKIKKFAVLENRFRHEVQLHEKCFFAVVTLVQLTMMVEEIPRDVSYEE